jgi:hypothetical protein
MTEEIDEPIETIEKHLHDFEEMMVKMEQKAKNCELKVCLCKNPWTPARATRTCGVCGPCGVRR